jgi:hypothetical protein
MAVEFGAGAENGEDVECKGQLLCCISTMYIDSSRKTAHKDQTGVESTEGCWRGKRNQIHLLDGEWGYKTLRASKSCRQ